MTQRISVTVSDETHTFLRGLAHEHTLAGKKAVSVSAAASELIETAIEIIRENDAKRAGTIASLRQRAAQRTANGGDRG